MFESTDTPFVTTAIIDKLVKKLPVRLVFSITKIYFTVQSVVIRFIQKKD